MDLSQTRRGEISIVAVTGRLTADCAAEFKRKMGEFVVSSQKIILDLSGMEYIDSTGLGAMVHMLQNVSDEGKQLKLACIQPKPQLVFNITRVYKLFDIYDSVDAAAEAMNA